MGEGEWPSPAARVPPAQPAARETTRKVRGPQRSGTRTRVTSRIVKPKPAGEAIVKPAYTDEGAHGADRRGSCPIEIRFDDSRERDRGEGPPRARLRARRGRPSGRRKQMAFEPGTRCGKAAVTKLTVGMRFRAPAIETETLRHARAAPGRREHPPPHERDPSRAAAPATSRGRARSGRSSPPKLVHLRRRPLPTERARCREERDGHAPDSRSRTRAEVAAVDVVGSAGPAFDAAAVAAGETVRPSPRDRQRKAHPRPDHVTATSSRGPRPSSRDDRRLRGDGPRSERKETRGAGEGPPRYGSLRRHRLRTAASSSRTFLPGRTPVTLSGERAHERRHERGARAGEESSTRPTRSTARRRRSPAKRRTISRSSSPRPRLDKQVIATEVAAEQGRKVPGDAGGRAQGRRGSPGRRPLRRRLGRARRLGAPRQATRASTSTTCGCRASTTTAATAPSCSRTWSARSS